ncbi:hypothetical protein ABFA25_00310 [Mycobacterium lepromatosis]|uniref:hypothetical protein n=1 Tax=Mycobacterium lepromatosis TaxID=480418 RepID=UPI003D809341
MATSATASLTASMADASEKLLLNFTKVKACGWSDTTKVRCSPLVDTIEQPL